MAQFEYRVWVEVDLDGWRAAVSGTAVVWVDGPHPDALAADAAVQRLLRRWRTRAVLAGGWAWRPRGSRLALQLPQEAAPRAALPFDGRPCSRVAPSRRVPAADIDPSDHG